jgi:hypothetical protein
MWLIVFPHRDSCLELAAYAPPLDKNIHVSYTAKHVQLERHSHKDVVTGTIKPDPVQPLPQSQSSFEGAYIGM